MFRPDPNHSFFFEIRIWVRPKQPDPDPQPWLEERRRKCIGMEAFISVQLNPEACLGSGRSKGSSRKKNMATKLEGGKALVASH